MDERSPVDPFLRGVRMRHRVVLNVAGLPMAFESNQRWPLDLARDAYNRLPALRKLPVATLRCLVTDDDADEALPPGTLTFGDARTESALISRANTATLNLAAHSALITLNAAAEHAPLRIRIDLIEFAGYRLAQHALRAIGVHAACVAQNGAGVLIMGDSGAGKSTLVAACLAGGWDVIAEDSTFLLPRGNRARGVPAFIHLMQDALVLFPEAGFERSVHCEIVRKSGKRKVEIDVRRYRNQQALPVETRLRGVIILTGSESAERAELPALQRVRQREAAAVLQRYQPYALAQPGWQKAISELCSLPIAAFVSGRNLSASVEALARFLKNHHD